MAQFDPAERRETWIFQELTTERGRSVWKRMRFNLVEYDRNPARYIEPVSSSDFWDVVSPQPDVLSANDRGMIVGIEYFQARPYEVHAFDDGFSA